MSFKHVIYDKMGHAYSYMHTFNRSELIDDGCSDWDKGYVTTNSGNQYGIGSHHVIDYYERHDGFGWMVERVDRTRTLEQANQEERSYWGKN